MTEELPTLRLDILGAGTVGFQVIRLLTKQSEEFVARSGTQMHVGAILTHTPNAPHNTQIAPELLATDPAEAIDRMNIVIELIDGIEPACAHVLRALDAGISVMTGNKTLLAAYGSELYAATDTSGADFYCEAAVAGAVPVVYGLRESPTENRITGVIDIVNGMTNFILDATAARNLNYEATLKQTQELGSAGAGPNADVEELDVITEYAVLASLAFHTRVGIEDVKVEGITRIAAEDMEEAAFSNRTIKLFAIAERRKNDQGVEGVSVRVHPALIPADNPLASVDGTFNAILVEGENAGRLMFYSQGAGGILTASAVLSDPVAAVHHHAYGGHAPRGSIYTQLPLLESGGDLSRFQIHLQVGDRFDVLAEIAGLSISNQVSIQALHQRDGAHDGASVVTLTAHHAKEADLRALIAALEGSNSVRSMMSTLHVERE